MTFSQVVLYAALFIGAYALLAFVGGWLAVNLFGDNAPACTCDEPDCGGGCMGDDE